MSETTQYQIEAERDNHAVDQFAAAMKEKLTQARHNGRGGWHDPDRCSASYLADLMIGHLSKGNEGTFEDVANFCMMLHQRGESPEVLQYTDRLARYEAQSIARTADVPADATQWIKYYDGRLDRYRCTWARQRGLFVDIFAAAPDYRPETEGNCVLPVMDVD